MMIQISGNYLRIYGDLLYFFLILNLELRNRIVVPLAISSRAVALDSIKILIA